MKTWAIAVGAGLLLLYGMRNRGGINMWATNKARAPFDTLFTAAEARYGLPAGLLARVAWQESRYDPLAVNARSRAQGLMQFMPATAREMGIDPLVPAQAIQAAARYLKQLHGQFGSWSGALAAYNWGPGNLARKGIALAPAETQQYYQSIVRDLQLT